MQNHITLNVIGAPMKVLAMKLLRGVARCRELRQT